MDYSVVLVFEMYLGQITNSSEPETTLTRAFSLPCVPFVGLTVEFPREEPPSRDYQEAVRDAERGRMTVEGGVFTVEKVSFWVGTRTRPGAWSVTCTQNYNLRDDLRSVARQLQTGFDFEVSDEAG